MNEIKIENGVCIAFGGTNARVADWADNDISNFSSVETPSKPDEFFKWMARGVLKAADDGAHWVVAGFPGPVSSDGKIVGPMANIPGLNQKEYDLAMELTKADPAAGRILEAGYPLVNVNDGPLASHSAAARMAQDKHDKVAALIIGTGQGTGIVSRDKDNPQVFREDRSNPTETGHLSSDPLDPTATFENQISGPAIERRTGIDARDLAAEHPVWGDVGRKAGQLALYLGLMNGAQLVVPTGGVGAGASHKFRNHMEDTLTLVREYGNATQRKFVPDVAYVDPKECQVFELYGAGGIMADVLSR
ncbi:MAG TPA: ROK family protein [Candidatus Limnocylindrales bacterium]|nr:ROK family protein [Candidatus Limnocylindrales bacterium]